MMFEEIVVGVDEGEGGLDAIALAKILAAPGAGLDLAHVIVGGPDISARPATEYAADATSHSMEEFERTRAYQILEDALDRDGLRNAGFALELHCLLAASVGRGLHALAETERADLIVLGSSRRSGVDRVLIGDDTRAGLDGAPAPVAVAPAGYARHPRRIRRIGVGYDGSPESEHAVRVARALAHKHGATLSAFTAVSVPTAAFGPGPHALAEAIDALQRNARERILALGRIEPHVAYGAASEELAMFSGSVDLLVVGSRGYGPLGRLVHGSTSRRLARTARCPLLVVTRPGDGAEAQSSIRRSKPATAGDER
jgi:nucleotide-binding universal stress UspA family protein